MTTPMRSLHRTAVAALISAATLATPTNAAPIFEVQLANPGVSIFRIENLSTASETLTSADVTIGDTDWNFDIVGGFTTMQDAGDVLTPTLVLGDMDQDLVRVDELRIDFTGFEVGDRFQFSTDLDEDSAGNTPADFRTIYWNNDPADNATITLSWRNTDQSTDQVTFTFPDDSVDKDVYTFVITPEPAALMLLLAGGLAVMIRHRRRV